MVTSGAPTKTAEDTAASDINSGPAQDLFGESDHRLARKLRPRLYYQITQEKEVSFDHIAKAWWFGNDPSKPTADKEKRERVSQFLEFLARKEFTKKHGSILRDYWSEKPFAACALTADGQVHSVMNITDPELVLYEDHVHQLCRDAHRTFKAAAHPSRKAEKDLAEVGEMLYVVLTRVIFTAEALEDKTKEQHERDEALAAVRIAWKVVRASVEGMIQRQARFEYFEGVGLGALLTIPALAFAGWMAVHYGANQLSEPSEPGSLTAAIIGGAAGAVISVTQRMTANTLMLDFRASKKQKIALGMLRPLVGAVFGAVVYFAMVGGLLAVNAKTGKDASIALAFFAVAGFAAGFSERFATDVLDRASSGILPSTRVRQDSGTLPSTRVRQDTEKPEELIQLLSEQPRHAGRRPSPTRPRQPRHKGTAAEKGEPDPQPSGHTAQPPAARQDGT